LPLIVHKKTRGVLVLGDLHVVAINDELKIFVQMVAEYLALFLENLYLKNKLRNHTNN
jgi:GAF domain-containing protein